VVNSIVGLRLSGNDLTASLGGLTWAGDGNLYAAAQFGGTATCSGGSVPGTWGCGGVVKIVPGDGTDLADSDPPGGPGDGDDGDSGGGGGGDGTTLAVLLLVLAAGCVARRTRPMRPVEAGYRLRV
jgi:hypothetical protein